MIFAHGPGSFLATHITKKVWGKNLNNKTIKLFLLFGGFFGLAVDFDILYTWFVDSTQSHHEYVTHTIFLPLVGLAFYGLFSLLKKEKVKALSFIFFIGTFSHLLLDSFAGTIMWAFPFSQNFYGLSSIDDLAKGVYGKNILLINILTELGIIFLALYVWIRNYTKSTISSIFGTIFSLTWVAATMFLFIFLQGAYQPGGNDGIKDFDNDGVVNFNDYDADGDGIDNINDTTPLGIDVSLGSEIKKAIQSIEGVAFDPSNGAVYEITKRLGFFNEKDVVEKVYGQIGIQFEQEIVRDALQQGNYPFSPESNNLTNDVQSYVQFFNNNQYSIPLDSSLKTGDIIVFQTTELPQERSLGVVTIDEQNQEKVTLVRSTTKKVESVFVSEARITEGEITTIARIIKD